MKKITDVSRRDFGQQWLKDEVVVRIDQLYVCILTDIAAQVFGRERAGEAAADDDDSFCHR